MGLVRRMLSWLVARFLLVLTLPVGLLRRLMGGKRRLTLVVKLRGQLVDVSVARTLPFGLGDGGETSLRALTEGLRAAAEDPRVEGAVLSIREFGGDYARLWELRRALEAFKAAGKGLVAYADSLDTATYWLASVADRIALTPAGGVDLLGVRAEVLFLRPLLDRLQVKADFIRIGRYKSYPETFTESTMSPEFEEALGDVLGDLDATLRGDIAAGRGMTPEAVDALIERGPLTGDDALASGLIDDLLYGEALEERLKAGWDALRAGETPEEEDDSGAVIVTSLGTYARRLAWQRWLRHPFFPRPRIVILEAGGAIVEGADRGMRGAAQNITRGAFQGALRALREDDGVEGVILRIDSPGGSALVSDILWEEVRRVGEAKPLWVSMATTAASGGYYIAAPAARIFAAPVTITGSIGVLAGKFSGGDLLERVGVVPQALERGGHAGVYSPMRPFTDSERAHLTEQIGQMYARFVGKVREGRGLGEAEAEAAAQGRIWSGLRAKGLGLVDDLGGLSDAVEALRAHLGDDRRRLNVTVYTQPAGFHLLRLLAGARATALFDGAAAWLPLMGSGTRILALLPWVRLR